MAGVKGPNEGLVPYYHCCHLYNLYQVHHHGHWHHHNHQFNERSNFWLVYPQSDPTLKVLPGCACFTNYTHQSDIIIIFHMASLVSPIILIIVDIVIPNACFSNPHLIT